MLFSLQKPDARKTSQHILNFGYRGGFAPRRPAAREACSKTRIEKAVRWKRGAQRVL